MALKVVSDLLIVSSSAAPGSPSSGYVVLYIGSDKNLYIKDSTGTVTKLNIVRS